MKKVLFISYLFPPLHCGVGRQVKLVKYLPEFGWSPTVLSAARSRVRPLYDDSQQMNFLNAEIHRLGTLESKFLIQTLPRVLGINNKYVAIPDLFLGWLPFAVARGARLISRGEFDLIFSTSLPHTNHLVGYILKKVSGLPWVADFRDAWTQNPFVSYPRIVRKLEERLEGSIVGYADKVTTINDPLKGNFQTAYPQESLEKFLSISHGYDPDDFRNVSTKQSPGFTICYTGSIYGRTDIRPFFLGVKKAIEDTEGLGKDLRIKLYGGVSSTAELITSLNLEKYTEIHDYVAKTQVFSLQCEADVLLLLIGVGKDDHSIITGKLLEYIGSGTPILAVAPEGVAADVIRSGSFGEVVSPDNPDDIKEAVVRFYERYKNGRQKFEFDRTVVEEFDVRKKVEQFAREFGLLVNGTSIDTAGKGD